MKADEIIGADGGGRGDERVLGEAPVPTTSTGLVSRSIAEELIGASAF
jgi:hypothetical protein